MKLCHARCPPICDFCIHYAFNGEPVEGYQFEVFTGDGFCRIDGAARWPEDGCENFVCQNWKNPLTTTPDHDRMSMQLQAVPTAHR